MSHPASAKTVERQHQQQVDRPSPEPARQPGPASPYTDILALQGAVGNRAVSQLLQSVTDSLPPATNGVPPVVQSVLNNDGGQPLEPAIGAVMESRLGHDFGHVRVHTDAQAAESAWAVNAASYTVGHDIVFGAGQYAPGTDAGRRLIAHELTHVVQQSQLTGVPASVEKAEQEADQAADQTIRGRGVTIRGSVSNTIQYQRLPELAQEERIRKAREGGAEWAKGGNPINPSAEKSHFGSEQARQAFIRGYIDYARRHNLKQQHEDARQAYPWADQPSSDVPDVVRDFLKSQPPPPPVNLSTTGADAFEPGIVSAKDVQTDPKWVENDIASDQLSDKAPWTYTLTYKDGSKLVIPLEQVFMETLPTATVTIFRKHKASGRIVPCVLSQSDPRLKTLKGPGGTDFSALADLATPRFDSRTAPKIVSLVNAAQMLFLGKGMLEVLQVQAMNPLMGGGMAAAGRAGGGSAARVGAGAAAKGLGEAAAKEGLTFVEIGAGDLKASIELAKKGGVKVIAVDPVAPATSAVQELQGLGGQFVKGVAADLAPGTADHVFQYFPWRITGTGSFAGGGTWRLVEDAVKLLKPNGAAHFVTEEFATAEFLAKEASKRGLRAAITETTAGAAAPGASGAGVPGFSKALKVWMVNIYK